MPNNVNVSPSVLVPNLPNPYALQYLKNLMGQPRPFMAANLTYPYPPIAYQPLPMLPQVCLFLFTTSFFHHFIFVFPSFAALLRYIIIILLIQLFSIDACV